LLKLRLPALKLWFSRVHFQRTTARTLIIILLVFEYHRKLNHPDLMNQSTKRSILRWIHIIFALPLLGFVYGPAAEVEQYRANFQFIFLPVVILTGIWMWKGPAIGRLFSKKST
jgi:hypothetical protein